jgi:hypothetical protein
MDEPTAATEAVASVGSGRKGESSEGIDETLWAQIDDRWLLWGLIKALTVDAGSRARLDMRASRRQADGRVRRDMALAGSPGAAA